MPPFPPPLIQYTRMRCSCQHGLAAFITTSTSTSSTFSTSSFTSSTSSSSLARSFWSANAVFCGNLMKMFSFTLNQWVLPTDDYGLGGVAMRVPTPKHLFDGLGQSTLLCCVFTFFLIFIVFHTAGDGTDVNFTAFAVGLYITVAVYAT